MAKPVPLSISALAAMGSVVAIYLFIKSPYKYRFISDSRLSPKTDLAWRNAAEKWLEKNSAE